MSNKSYIFIIENEEIDNLSAGRQIDIDNEIKYSEENNQDLDFKVIGRILEPNGPRSLKLDFDEKLIEWFDGEERDTIFIKKAILAITNIIR